MSMLKIDVVCPLYRADDEIDAVLAGLAAQKNIILPTHILSPRISPAPKYLAASRQTPSAMPSKNPKIKKVIAPVAPTEARAELPRKRPTIIVSAQPYSC